MIQLQKANITNTSIHNSSLHTPHGRSQAFLELPIAIIGNARLISQVPDVLIRDKPLLAPLAVLSRASLAGAVRFVAVFTESLAGFVTLSHTQDTFFQMDSYQLNPNVSHEYHWLDQDIPPIFCLFWSNLNVQDESR